MFVPLIPLCHLETTVTSRGGWQTRPRWRRGLNNPLLIWNIRLWLWLGEGGEGGGGGWEIRLWGGESALSRADYDTVLSLEPQTMPLTAQVTMAKAADYKCHLLQARTTNLLIFPECSGKCPFQNIHRIHISTNQFSHNYFKNVQYTLGRHENSGKKLQPNAYFSYTLKIYSGVQKCGHPWFNCLLQWIGTWSKANLNSIWFRVKYETFLYILWQECCCL